MTSEGQKHQILFVDDEESITKALQRLFRKDNHEIHVAQGGEEGLRILRESAVPFSLIVSDQRMPGMSGAEFLEKAREIVPRAIRILLTGYSDMNAIVDAVNRGQIHRYMTKPWNDDDLLFTVRQSLEQYDLVMENIRLLDLTKSQNDELAELNKTLEVKVEERTREILVKNQELSRLNQDLEQNLYNAVKAFSSLLERYSPALAGHGRRVAQLSREIGAMLDLPENELTQVEIAAHLHDFGKLSFPAKLMDYREEIWSVEDRRLYHSHPQLGQETVHFISKLDHVGLLIRSHHERYDGNGYPDRLAEEEIPLGARIIAVADAFDKIVSLRVDVDGSVKGLRQSESRLADEELHLKAALSHLRRESLVSYDPDIVKKFLLLQQSRPSPESRKAAGKGPVHYFQKNAPRAADKVPVQELRPGMVLSRALYTKSGRYLLPAHTVLTENFIDKINSLHETDSVSVVHIFTK
jgi:response regulator RpfG family c-di-GMP phosphodiesterase